MCGIVGCIGKKPATPILLESLNRLEYRGYDSAGIALLNHDLIIIKKAGRISNLEKGVENLNLGKYYTGIGHTRWGTHGEATDINAHPHTNRDGTIAVVHNGIIENYEQLRKKLEDKGYYFKTNSDTEVVPHLIDYYLKKDKKEKNFEKAFRKTLNTISGANALAVLHKGENKIYCSEISSTLIIGFSSKDKSIMVASSEEPFCGNCEKKYILKDRQMAIISQEYEKGFIIKNFDGLQIEKLLYAPVPDNIASISNEGFETFMLKEIHEQSKSVKMAVGGRLNHLQNLALDNFPHLPKDLRRIMIACCGTSYHAALIGSNIIEKKAGIECRVEPASEFIYREPVLHRDDFFIAISQSGETADTLAALKLAKNKGCYVAGIVNVVSSAIAREAGKGLYLHAGPEIGVASTKAFTSQVAALLVLNSFLVDNKEYTKRLKKEFDSLDSKIEKILKKEDEIKEIGQKISGFKGPLFLGRGINYPVALEGALKFKELTYRSSQGYPAGEMKHGPIALIDEETPTVFVLSGRNEDYKKTLSNIREIKARRGKIIAITDNPEPIIKMPDFKKNMDFVIQVPKTIEELSPILNVIPLQLLAYHSARFLGKDVDKPRNLAKSVTVE